MPDLDIPRYIKLMQAGLMQMGGIITHELELDNVNDAIKILRSGEAGRVVLKMN